MRLLLTTAFVCLGWASAASAQTRNPMVDQLIEEGLQQRERNRDASAIATFERALRLDPRSGEVRGQLALAELSAARRNPRVGAAHFLRALTFLDETLNDHIDPWVRRHRTTLERELRRLRDSFGTVVVPLGPGTAQRGVVLPPGSGSVRIIAPGLDEQRALPLNMELPAGQYALSIRVEGYELLVREVSVTPGDVASIVESEFVRARPTPLPAFQPPAPEASPEPPTVDLSQPNDFDAAGMTELPTGMVVAFDSDVYRHRRNRRLGFFAGAAPTAAVLGLSTFLTRPEAGESRNLLNINLMVASAVLGASALVVLISALTMHGRWRRSLIDPDPLALSF